MSMTILPPSDFLIMNVNNSFHHFCRLPLELRRLVWFQCLPRRIAEEDVPYTLLDGKESRQACWPNRTTLRNAQVPLVASVCREARDTVFECGKHQKSHDSTSLWRIWLQPQVDRALHLNWNRQRNEQFYTVHDAYVPSSDETPVVMLIHRAHWKYGMKASLLADLICPFDLETLIVDSIITYDYSPSSDVFVWPFLPSIFLESMKDEREEDLYSVVAMPEINVLYLTLMAISLHVDKAAALESGLFGLLGDAPIQLVEFDHGDRIRRFYELYRRNDLLKHTEPHVGALFRFVLSPEFRAAVLSWRETANWLLQAAVWKRTKTYKPESFGGTDPSLVWKPPLVQGDYRVRMDQHSLDEALPWWEANVKNEVPHLIPQIMVRLCDNQCYKEENRPENFGQASFWDYWPQQE